jgi:endonuclease-3
VDPEKSRKLLKYELAPGREGLLARMLAGETRAELRASGFGLDA